MLNKQMTDVGTSKMLNSYKSLTYWWKEKVSSKFLYQIRNNLTLEFDDVPKTTRVRGDRHKNDSSDVEVEKDKNMAASGSSKLYKMANKNRTTEVTASSCSSKDRAMALNSTCKNSKLNNSPDNHFIEVPGESEPTPEVTRENFLSVLYRVALDISKIKKELGCDIKKTVNDVKGLELGTQSIVNAVRNDVTTVKCNNDIIIGDFRSFQKQLTAISSGHEVIIYIII
jgi:hypothetical protein